MMRILTLGSLLVALCPAGVSATGGVVALQTAEASCRDGSSVTYVDCGNGTVTDNRTGLVWLKNADCLGDGVDWYTAMEFVAGLADMPAGSAAAEHDCGLSDGSSTGEWRLPSAAEWETMVGDAVDLGCSPTITSDSMIFPGCWSAGCNSLGLCAFSDVQSALSTVYWSSTTLASTTFNAWAVGMNGGSLLFVLKNGSTRHVWPVRGGQ